MCSEAPDMSGANAAALAQAELSAEQLAWFKDLEASSRPMREAAAARQNQVSDAQLALMRQQQQLTTEANQRYKSTFQPIEDRIASEALAYDTPARREAEAGQAMADVGSQVDLARAGVQRELASRGVDAGSGNAAIALSRMALGEGAAKAAAGNTARKQVETIGAAKLMDAAGLGRGVVSNQATTAGLALNAGNASGQNAGAALNTATSGANLMQAGYQGAQQGLAGAANTHLGIGRIEQAASDNSGLWGAVGSVAGAAMGNPAIWSDEHMKENVAPVDGEVALSQVRVTPVKEWEYKDDSPAADGGQRHVGPMAQDVQAAMGDQVAPGGQQIDLISMNGKLTAAVQQLDEEVQDMKITLASVITGKKARKEKSYV